MEATQTHKNLGMPRSLFEIEIFGDILYTLRTNVWCQERKEIYGDSNCQLIKYVSNRHLFWFFLINVFFIVQEFLILPEKSLICFCVKQRVILQKIIWILESATNVRIIFFWSTNIFSLETQKPKSFVSSIWLIKLLKFS